MLGSERAIVNFKERSCSPQLYHHRKNQAVLTHSMSNSLEQLCLNDSRCLPNLEALKKSESLTAMVWAAWLLGMSLATFFVEQELAVRAVLPTKWPTCPKCHCCLRSKGRRSRQIQTLVGRVHWKRRVGRCPTGCKGSQLATLEVALGVKPHDSDQSGISTARMLVIAFLKLMRYSNTNLL